MNKAFCALLLAAVFCLTFSLQAQTAESACPSTRTLDDLIKAIDAAVTGPADKDRTCMRQIFVSDARLIPLAKGPDGNLVPKTLTLDDWIARVKQHVGETLYEHQLKYTTDVYGHIAHLWSTYETKSGPDGKTVVRGINSIQAVKIGDDWKVAQILWEAETPMEPVPQQYLPKR